jgi:hypothetical protein
MKAEKRDGRTCKEIRTRDKNKSKNKNKNKNNRTKSLPIRTVPKRLGLAREFVPSPSSSPFLVNDVQCGRRSSVHAAFASGPVEEEEESGRRYRSDQWPREASQSIKKRKREPPDEALHS